MEMILVDIMEIVKYGRNNKCLHHPYICGMERNKSNETCGLLVHVGPNLKKMNLNINITKIVEEDISIKRCNQGQRKKRTALIK